MKNRLNNPQARSVPERPGSIHVILAVLALAACMFALDTLRQSDNALPGQLMVLSSGAMIIARLAGVRKGLASTIPMSLYGPLAMDSTLLTSDAGLTLFSATLCLLLSFALIVHQRQVRLQRLLTPTLHCQSIHDAHGGGSGDSATNLTGHSTGTVRATPDELERAFRYSPVGVMVLGKDNHISSVNPAALRQFGIQSLPKEWKDATVFFDNVPIYAPNGERFSTRSGPILDALTIGTVTDEHNCRIAFENGTSGWFRGCFAPTRSASGEISGATMTLLDVRNKIIAEKAMENVARRALNTQEEERAHLARHLNDEIAQRVAAVKLKLHAALGGNATDQRIRECIADLNSQLDSIRDLSMELRPAELDDLGLISAIRWYLTRQQKKGNLAVSLDADIQMPTLPSDIAAACFRIVQEAVTNAIRHAKAQSLVVRLFLDSSSLCIEVIDDGCGFDVQDFIERGGSGDNGFGLLAMRERTRLADGEFNLSSEPGLGTSVSVCFAFA